MLGLDTETTIFLADKVAAGLQIVTLLVAGWVYKINTSLTELIHNLEKLQAQDILHQENQQTVLTQIQEVNTLLAVMTNNYHDLATKINVLDSRLDGTNNTIDEIKANERAKELARYTNNLQQSKATGLPIFCPKDSNQCR